MQNLSIDATNDNLAQVMDFVDSVLESNGCPMKTQMQIDLSVEEVYVNIANYAYGRAVGRADISASCNNGEFAVTFADSGTPYNPLAKPDPDITLPAEERQIGGLGIFLVKKTMDTVSYKHVDGKNVLTITKRIH